MINPDTFFNGMMFFYLIIAVVGLTIAIIAYPSVREHSTSPSNQWGVGA